MKILACMNYDVFRLSLGWALESLGHKVYHLNTIDEALIEEAISTFQPDLYVDMGWDTEHEKGHILKKVLKRHRIFHLYFAEEDYLHFERWSRVYVRESGVDFVLTRSRDCIAKYEKMGIQAAYLDVGCVPEFHRPLCPNPVYQCDIAILVNPHFKWASEKFRKKSMEDLVVPLFRTSLDIQLWGREWHKAKKHFKSVPKKGMYKGVLPFYVTPQVYSSAKINISVQSVTDQISNRTYDILTSGGFLLTSDTPGVREKLIPGVHCDVSNSPEETLEKVSFYLKNENARKRIARKGWELARKEFAYKPHLINVWPLVEKAYERYRKGDS